MMARAYLSIFRIRIQTELTYRAALWADIAVNVFYGFLQVVILILFYQFGIKGNLGMTVEQAVTYSWLSTMLHFMMPFGGDPEMHGKIVSGSFAYELCRPLNLYNHMYTRSLAQRIGPLIVKILPMVLFRLILPKPYNMQLPVSFVAFVVFIFSLMLAVLLSAAFCNLLNTNMLIVERGVGINTFITSVIMILAGSIIPLPIFPDYIVRIIRYLPFAGLMDTPASIYTGLITPLQALPKMAMQVGWIFIMIILGKVFFKSCLKKTVIQGG